MNPENLRYTEDHEWIGEENGLWAVGITDHAQEQLGDITYVELPKVGRKVTKGAETAVVESVKAASDIYSPVDGVVAEVNETIEVETELVNKDPYGKGWFFKLSDVDSAQVAELMDLAAYENFCKE